jgi:hypothetical protein
MNELEGFAVEEKKTGLLDKLVEVENISYAVRVYLSCYFIFTIFAVYVFMNYGYLGLFLTSVGSLLVFYKVPFMTIVSLILVIFSGVTVLLDVTGLGILFNNWMDWLWSQSTAQGVKK